MIKSIINKYVKAILDELFIDAPSVQLSMGADMFSDSKINLSNLSFRPDVFDVSLQPFKLISGHVGSLNVEGIAELALGGKLKLQIENVFILLGLDQDSDPEKIQTMKKVLLEMQMSKFPNDMLLDIMKKVYSMPLPPQESMKKKREVLYKAMEYATQGLFYSVKNVHVRVEFPHTDELHCDAIGFILPALRFGPTNTHPNRPDGIPRNAPLSVLSCKSIQFYCDYDRLTYQQSDHHATASFFLRQWKSEVHTSLVMPFDIDLVFGFDIKRRTGLISPKLSITIPQLRFCIDQQQVRVLADIVEALVRTTKRFDQASRVQKIFRQGYPLPKVYLIGGAKVLPHMVVKGRLYPLETGLPTPSGGGIVAFMKQRVGNRWPEMLWKHLIRCVLHDVRQSRPHSRWMEIVRLSTIRREYAFLYAKLIKRADDGSFIFNVNAQVSATKLRDLFEFEMQLPIETIVKFRTLAYLIAMAGYIYLRKSSSDVNNEGNTSQSLRGDGHRRFIGWHDILKIYVELFEAQRESAFHLFDRSNGDSVFDENDDYFSVLDDSMTNRGSDDGTQSVFSYSLQSRTTLTPTNRRSGNHTPDRSSTGGSFTFNKPHSPVPANTTASTAAANKLNPFFSKITSTLSLGTKANDSSTSTTAAGVNKMKAAAQNVSSLQNTTKKLFGGFSLSGADDYDSKVLGKMDLSVFNRSFGNVMRQEEKINKDGTADAVVLTQQMENEIRYMHKSPYALHPSFADIASAVQTALQRFQSPLTIMPPDISFKLNKINADVKTIAGDEERMTLFSVTGEGVQLTMTVSRSSSTTTFNSKSNTPANVNRVGEADREDNLKVVRGFASLTGALIQLRLVMKQCMMSIALPVEKPSNSIMSAVAVHGQKTSKGSTLQSGLPSYSISDPVKTLFTDASNHGDSETASQHSASQIINTKESNDDTESDYHQLFAAKNQLQHDSDEEEEQTTTSVHNDNESITSKDLHLRQIPGTKTSYIPGKTIMASIHEQEEHQLPPLPPKNQSVENTMQTPVRVKGDSNNHMINGNFSIETSLEDMTSATKKADKHNRFEMRQIMSSAPAENVFVLCVILDLDDQGDGAGDIQLALGGMRVDLSKRALSAMISPELLLTLQDIQRDMQRIKVLRPILDQTMVIMDWEENLPVVQLCCDPPLDILERWMKQQDERAATIPPPASPPMNNHKKQPHMSTPQRNTDVIDATLLSPESVRSYERDHHDNDDDSSADSVSDNHAHEEQQAVNGTTSNTVNTIETLVERKERLSAMLFNKNVMQWLSLLEAHLPKILTFSMRTSAIVIQSLEASMIRDLVYAKIRAMIDKASKRQHKEDEDSSSLFSTSSISGLLANLLYAWMDYPMPVDNKRRYQISSRYNTSSKAFDAFRRVKKWGVKGQSIVRDSASEGGNNISMNNINGQAGIAAAANYKLKMLLPALDFAVTKVITPYPAVDVNIQGTTMLKIPVSDETLCHYLAWYLANNMPIYI